MPKVTVMKHDARRPLTTHFCMAGFEVIMYGRFWVTAEVAMWPYSCRRGCEHSLLCGRICKLGSSPTKPRTLTKYSALRSLCFVLSNVRLMPRFFEER